MVDKPYRFGRPVNELTDQELRDMLCEARIEILLLQTQRKALRGVLDRLLKKEPDATLLAEITLEVTQQ